LPDATQETGNSFGRAGDSARASSPRRARTGTARWKEAK
jgi:hypothetical protein